jgi:hypothetical protein
MAAVGFYNADVYVISMGGIRIQGFADGEFANIKPTRPKFERVVGVDGEVGRARNSDRTVIVKLILFQTSASNLYLSTLIQTDMDAPNGAGVVPLLMQDISGNSIVSADQAWCVDFPELSYDRGIKTCEWTIETGMAIFVAGGNH